MADIHPPDGKTKPVSYMVKLPHQLEVYQEMMKRTNIFDIERSMYNEVVPEMADLYKEVGVDITFGAKSYDLKNAKTDYVALEDLGIKGFKNANRLEGLDQTHTERVLLKLAQWHAASAVRVATILLEDTDESDEESTGRSYTCDLCDLNFRRRREMSEHQYSLHSFDKLPHSCEHCIFKTVDKVRLPFLFYNLIK